MNRAQRRERGIRVRLVKWTPTPDSAISKSFLERAELAVELNDRKRAREAISAWLERAPQDQVDILVALMRARWATAPDIDTRGNRRVLARTIVDYLEREDRHLEAAS